MNNTEANMKYFESIFLKIPLMPVAAPGGNRGNVPPPPRNPEKLQRIGNSPRLRQQWESILENFSNFR